MMTVTNLGTMHRPCFSGYSFQGIYLEIKHYFCSSVGRICAKLKINIYP